MSSTLQEFIVTLKNYDDLENFYQEMETEGTSIPFVPSRAVSCIDRRPASRNTHYLLTREEARDLRNDERIDFVQIRMIDKSFTPELHSSQTGNWSRSPNLVSEDLNWGLYRCLQTTNTPQWGSENIGSSVINETIKLDASGKNVDIVIVDEMVDPDHPEFSDGNGGSRVIQYDWFGQHDLAVRGTGCTITHVARNNNVVTITTQTAHNINIDAVINVVCTSDNSFNATGVTVTAVGVTSGGNGGDGITVNTISYAQTGTNVTRTSATGFWRGVYQYGVYNNENNHATHVAGIVAGNTQGWARGANIYNLRHNALGADAEQYTPNNLIYNYIREFHNSKSINPETGRKNPTIVNNSWGLGVDFSTSLGGARNRKTQNFNFTKLNYRGTDVFPAGDPLDTGYSGICSATAQIAGLNVAPTSGNSITTTGTAAGTVTSVTYSPNGRTGLTQVSPTFFDATQFSFNDEAYWTLTLPFNITYLTQSYSQIHVNSNSYVTFGGPATSFLPDFGTPAIRKILVSAGDRSCEDIWTGTFGTAGSRTYVVRYEGYEGAYSTEYETTPTVIWELKFFEATPSTFELHVIENSNYRGEFTEIEMLQRGLRINENANPARSLDIDADIADAINDGIIFVGSAGNSGIKIDTEGGTDYDNIIVLNGLPLYYQRGSSPAVSHPDVICVGGINSASDETKATDSNTGPRVDVYAPGVNVISSVFDNTGVPFPTITESNGGDYQKRTGTSTACAQVTGILALALENYPQMTPAEAKSFVTKFARETINDTAGNYEDLTSLQGSPNRFAYYRKERPDNGLLIPKTVRYIRPDTGVVFPRPQIRRN